MPSSSREPFLPETFALASAVLATTGWLFLVVSALAVFGVVSPFQFLDRLGVPGAVTYGTALIGSGAAPLVAIVAFARARSPRMAAFGFRSGLAAFLLIIVTTIAMVIIDARTYGGTSTD